MEKQLLYLLDYDLRLTEDQLCHEFRPFMRPMPAKEETRSNKATKSSRPKLSLSVQDAPTKAPLTPPLDHHLPTPVSLIHPVIPLVESTRRDVEPDSKADSIPNTVGAVSFSREALHSNNPSSHRLAFDYPLHIDTVTHIKSTVSTPFPDEHKSMRTLDRKPDPSSMIVPQLDSCGLASSKDFSYMRSLDNFMLSDHGDSNLTLPFPRVKDASVGGFLSKVLSLGRGQAYASRPSAPSP
jgi:hypothetical protein